MSRYKGDDLLSSGDQFKITADGGKHSLNISNLESSHGGQYTVKGSNEFGASRCTATLLLQGIIFISNMSGLCVLGWSEKTFFSGLTSNSGGKLSLHIISNFVKFQPYCDRF